MIGSGDMKRMHKCICYWGAISIHAVVREMEMYGAICAVSCTARSDRRVPLFIEDMNFDCELAMTVPNMAFDPSP
jgi:hypothetical protein